jgi:anion-transporting  ArsA/GET3 family ATPase
MSTRRILRKKVILCVGAGGVGKTTVAASIAVASALRGRQTAVITVDPARRLKDALGLGELSADARPVALAGAPDAAPLHAFALDAKHTFDALVERFAGSAEAAQRILQNRLYHEISTGLAGSAEYMAMEKLHHLVTHERYDTVVVDTPPSAHARDLLGAPNRLLDLLASRAVGLLRSPGSLLSGTNSLARMTLSTLLKALERWTGMRLLEDLAEFTNAFEYMMGGFAERAEQVEKLLHSPSTAFVLVTTPEPHTVATSIEFHRELSESGYPVAGIIANRVLAFPKLDESALPGNGIPERLRQRLLANYEDLRSLSRRDARMLVKLQSETGAPLLAAIPLLVELPVSVAQLRRFAQYLA